MIIEINFGEFNISTDPKKISPEAIHAYLSTSYWANGRSLKLVKKSLQNSLNFGVYHKQNQVGLARVITDYSTFAYLCDVYILEEYRGKGLSKILLKTVMEYPEFKDLRRWMLATKDAHGLYQKFGFKNLDRIERWMEKFNPNSGTANK